VVPDGAKPGASRPARIPAVPASVEVAEAVAEEEVGEAEGVPASVLSPLAIRYLSVRVARASSLQ